MPLKFIVLQKCYICTLLVLGANLAIAPNPSYAIAPQESNSRGGAPGPAPEPAKISQNLPPFQQYNPSPFPNSTIPISRYAVYVNGDSPLLLQFVQQVEPTATVFLYKERRVILAGSFFDEISAQQRVLQLQSIGIQAQVTNFKDGQEFSNLIPFQQPNYYPIPPIAPPAQQPNFIPPSAPNYLPPNNPGTGSGLYQVVVDPASTSLTQVRRVESRAFVREYGGVRVIQAGSFGDRFNAEKRVEKLATQGIAATIVRSSQENINPFLNQNQRFSPPSQGLYIPPAQVYVPPAQSYIPPAQNLTQNNANYYFVVISGNLGELTQIKQEILRLGIPGDTVVAREIGDDPHVKVGPFPDQPTAERWEKYLRDSGIKTARVYFGQY
ncbi:hypothetical protein BCD67_08050 [Oscillatoriales cyanobacterium USR001]|nr:hypothetical protein BCD67_08050 [Oscillatoriales cyanobacterium USR001]